MLHVDDVQFRRPVEIGNLLRLNASVVATRSDVKQPGVMAVEVCMACRLSSLHKGLAVTSAVACPPLTNGCRLKL